MSPRNRVSLRRFSSWLVLLISLVFTASSHATQLEMKHQTASTFRWIHPNSDPQLWQQIESAFQDELGPDDAKSGQDGLDVYRYKYLQKVGILCDSALVIIGRRPAKEVTEENAWDEYYSAFNFDLTTKEKSSIEHAEVMWKWKFIKLAKFGPSPVPDVAFTYLTCTECEPSVTSPPYITKRQSPHGGSGPGVMERTSGGPLTMDWSWTSTTSIAEIRFPSIAFTASWI